MRRHRTAPEGDSWLQHKIHWLQRAWRFHHMNVVHRSRDPHGAAQSFALGVFLGFMPISVFATVLALLIPRKLGWRTIPAVVGTFTSNWLTAPFILGASVLVGRLVTTGEWGGFHELIPHGDGVGQKFEEYLHLGASFFLGITLVSLAAAGVAYLVLVLLIRTAIRLRQQRVVERLKQHLHVPHLPHFPHLPHLPVRQPPPDAREPDGTPPPPPPGE